MKCPNCNELPSTLLRFSFSLQGVSIGQSMKGYFRCSHCGSLLRVGSFRKEFWFLFGGSIAALAAFILLYRRFFLAWGSGATALIWMILVVLIAAEIIYGTWKYAQAVRVPEENAPAGSPT